MNDQQSETSSERRAKSGDRRKSDRRVASVETRTILENQYVFRENETGDLAFVVKKGAVQISKTDGSSELVLGTVGTGGMFGEMALIDESPRMASAKATGGPVELMVISRQMFERKLDTMDPFTRALINILAQHVRTLAADRAKDKLRAS